MLLDLSRDLRTSGSESIESVRWRYILVDRVLPARALLVPDAEKLVAWRVILQHAKECERLVKLCVGADSEQFAVLRQTRESTETVVQMIVHAQAEDDAAAGD